MKRLLCVVALAAVVMLPDWASACWRRGGRPVYARYYAPVSYRPLVYRAPVSYATQPVYHQPVYCEPVYVQPHPRMTPPAQPLQPPRIVPVRPMNSGAAPDPGAAPGVAQPEPAPPGGDPLRPASGAEFVKPQPARPEPAPEPREPSQLPRVEIPAVKSDEKPPASPAPKADESKGPKVFEPKIGGNEVKLPPLELPKDDTKAKPVELPKGDANPPAPKLDPSGGPAVPVPAPAPDVLIPPPDLPTKKPDSLPPLTLPPDTPVSPKEVEVKSSPLRALNVSVFAASGSKSADGLRKIGFYNHTKRDLALTIEGKSVTLPAMSYLHANLPPTFTWKCPDRPAAKETVPADAAGVDVVIRE
jgi:hypothetical protein